MAQAQRDDNMVVVGMGVNADDGVTPLPILMDPSTNRVLIMVQLASDTVPVLPSTKRDANSVPVAYGVNDTDRATPMPLLINSTNNMLWVDITS